MNINIHRAIPEEAALLSRIAFSAKAYWGYPERWLEIWKPQFDFPPKYFEQYESWTAEYEDEPIAFYTLQVRDGSAWIENMWVLAGYIGKGVGKILFLHAISRSR